MRAPGPRYVSGVRACRWIAAATLSVMLGTTRLGAQAAWSPRASGVAANLWGVAAGGDQFVAVGERGTILSSPDGATWTARASGTDKWLLAATYDWGHFVVVGDAGTILVSRDAVTWRTVEIAGNFSARWPYVPRRLNAVAVQASAWGGGTPSSAFNAVGEDGVAVWGLPLDPTWGGIADVGAGWIRGIAYGAGREVRVGRDGVSLTYKGPITENGIIHTATAFTPRVGANLESIVFARDQFVAVGQAGAVFVSANATNWNERPRFTSAHLFGVAYFNHEFVAVGDGGAVWRTSDTAAWSGVPVVTSRVLRAVAAATDRIVAVGEGGTILSSDAAPRAPAVVEPPADATANVGGAAAFRVVVAGSLPLAYQWLRDGQPVSGATAATLVLSPANAELAGRYQLRATNPAGTITSAIATLTVQPAPATPIVDPTFRGEAAIDGNPAALLPLADGRVLLALQYNDRAELVRLLVTGKIDPAFRRGVAAVDEFEPQLDIYRPTIVQLIAQPDGRVLAAGHFMSFNGVARSGLARLNSDGAVDQGFTVAADVLSGTNRFFAPRAALQSDGKILITTDSGGLVRLLSDGQRDPTFALAPAPVRGVSAMAIDPSGRIFVGSGGEAFKGGTASVSAVLSDGRADPAFTPYACDAVTQLHAVGGGVVVSTNYDRGPFTNPRFPATTFRLTSTGALDPAFAMRNTALGAPPAPDGSLLVGSMLIAANGGTETSPNLGVGFQPSYVKAFGPDGRLWIAGPFSVYHGVATSRVARLNLVPTENLEPPRVLAAWAERPVIRLGEPVTLQVAAIGPGPLTYTWRLGGSPNDVVTSEPSYSFVPDSIWLSGEYSVRVSNSAGSAAGLPFDVTIQPGELRIASQPRRVSLTPGKLGIVYLRLATSSQPTKAMWFRNGLPLPTDGSGVIRGAESRFIDFGLVHAAQAGSYAVTMSDYLGQTLTSDPIEITVGDVARFVNLSTRASVGPGEQAPILGFVIPPGQYRQVILRGIGPGLADFGVAGVLADPRLDVYDSTGRVVARSDGWQASIIFEDPVAAFAKFGAFPLSAGSCDAGLIVGLNPGSYTARLSGVGNTTGVGLIELYEADNNSDRLINISSRVYVGNSPAAPAIAGFSIQGAAAKRVLVRAAGPALAAFGVGGSMANPRLEIRNSSGAVVASNDDWQSQPDASAVATAAVSAGAFAFAAGSKDSALVLSLPAGNYTALVSAADGGSGVSLVEVYEVP